MWPGSDEHLYDHSWWSRYRKLLKPKGGILQFHGYKKRITIFIDIKLSPYGSVTQIRENSSDFTEEKYWWIQLVCLFQCLQVLLIFFIFSDEVISVKLMLRSEMRASVTRIKRKSVIRYKVYLFEERKKSGLNVGASCHIMAYSHQRLK